MSENTDWDDPESIKQKAREERAQHEAEKSELLAAVAEGEQGISVEDYETVEVGQVEIKVKAWMPGDSLNAIERAQRLANRENITDALEGISTMKDGMTAVTVEITSTESGVSWESDADIREFWDGMINQWGITGFQEAAQIVLEPASEDLQAKGDAAEGFRQDAERSKPRDYS